MTQSGYLLLGLTAIVGGLAALVVFALLRFAEAARRAQRGLRDVGTETALMAGALEATASRLREQGLAMQARAEASERLSDEIIASMTSGLLVVGQTGSLLTVNPAGRKLLGQAILDRNHHGKHFSIIAVAEGAMSLAEAPRWQNTIKPKRPRK